MDKKSVTECIKEALTAAGYSERIGGAFGPSNHGCGLPQVERVSVRPDYSPIDGGHMLLVTATTVESWVLPIPTNHNDWQANTSRHYKTPEEMVKIVGEMINTGRGCW